MSAKFQHFRNLYEKYKTSSASAIEIEEFLNFLRNPENLEVLKQEMNRDWQHYSSQQGASPLRWQDIEMEIRKQNAQHRKHEHNRKVIRWRWAAAASLLVLASFIVGIYQWSISDEFVTYETGYGQVEKIVLDDGSQVTLNANSELKWKRSWENDRNRIAILRGEAFFNVSTILTEDSGGTTRFVVHTEDLNIQVMGTEFNVKSRSSKTDIFLKEGKIKLDLRNNPDDSLHYKAELIVMEPGESVSYSATTQKLEKAESDHYGNASWMAGTFMYSNKTVGEILQSLQEIYGVQFVVEDPILLERKLTTNLPYSDWPIVESGLELILQAQLENKDARTIIIKRE